eukprot:11434100-Alexandrium_andersonii.AAC.1
MTAAPGASRRAQRQKAMPSTMRTKWAQRTKPAPACTEAPCAHCRLNTESRHDCQVSRCYRRAGSGLQSTDTQ